VKESINDPVQDRNVQLRRLFKWLVGYSTLPDTVTNRLGASSATVSVFVAVCPGCDALTGLRFPALLFISIELRAKENSIGSEESFSPDMVMITAK
jgi:hypothetical protein